MKIIFSHGKKGSPTNEKMSRLMAVARDMGFDTIAIDYTDTKKPEKRLNLFFEHFEAHENEEEEYILVGSSMGGYVSLVAAETVHPKACFLLCPALYVKGYEIKHYEPNEHMYIEIVHGWKDMTVLPEMSMRFARESHCTLHLIDTDHNMLDSFDYVEFLFEAFLKKFI